MTVPVTSSVSCTIEVPMLTETQTGPHFLQGGALTMPYNYTGVNQANLKKDSSLLLLKLEK